MNGPVKPLSDDEVIALVLDGLANDGDLDEIREALYLAHDPRTGFPGRLLLELASNAFRAVGATTADPLELDDIDRRFLADWPARHSAGHQKRRYAFTGAVLLAAGAEPEGTGWWRVDDLWFHAFHAVIVYVPDLADRLDVSRQTIYAIETGRYDPSLPLAFKIAAVFGERIEDLFFPAEDDTSD